MSPDGSTRDATGRSPARRWYHVRRRSADVREQVRLMRAVDEYQIALVDAEIEDLRKLIGEKQAKRKQMVMTAWRHGLDVRLPELVAQAEANLPAVTS